MPTDMTGLGKVAAVSIYGKVCHCRLTVEGEVPKHRRNNVKQEAEANTDVCNVLHPALSRSERHKDTFAECNVYVAAEQ